MDTLVVVVISSVSNVCLEQIAAVSPKIKILDTSRLWDSPDLVTAEREGDFTSEDFNALLGQAEVIYGWRPPKNLLARAPKLKWIQGMAAGADDVLDSNPDILKSSVILTTASGIHGTPVGELALELIIMLAKKAPYCLRNQQEKKWQRFVPMLLHSKTVGIVGLGHIGNEIARLTKAFGMRVIAIRRSAKRVTRTRYVDKVMPGDQMLELFTESDFVVLALPITSGTLKLIGENELKVMKPTAFLINVGRGNTVDEDSLIHALEENWIAGAGLDAHVTEPLPINSKFWELTNVIVSPHVGGIMEDYNERATALFCDNLRRYLDGKKLRNIVSKKHGY